MGGGGKKQRERDEKEVRGREKRVRDNGSIRSLATA